MNEKLFKEIDWRMKVFDSLSYPTLIMTLDKIIVSGNQVFFDKFETTLEDIVGKTCYEVFYNAKQCPNEKCPWSRVIAERKGQSILHSVTTKTRRKLWEDRVFSPILGDDGEVAYILESVRDVTRVKNLEIALKETEAFLEKIITGSPIAIVVADRYGNILLMNPAAQELFGYSSVEAAINISAANLYPEGVAAEIQERLKDEKIGGKGKLPSMNTTIQKSDGEEIPVEITASIIYEDEEEIAVVGIYTDLREKQAVEKKLKDTRARLAQSEKMASIGQLAAGVAHEINNPLTGILFYAEMKQAELTADDPERAEVAAVIEDVNRCRDIVKNLLAYSRQSNPTKEIIQLNEIIDQSLTLIRDPKALMNIEIIKEIYTDKILVHVDRNQICRVVINLVMNAVSSMEGSGTLTFRTYRDTARQKAVLEIEDSGCGISKEHLPRIFDPFFTTKKLGEGTGLGLSTVYGLIRENKGLIEVKQTSEKGTTFRVELPLLQSIESAGQEP
ncbi:MAG: PAS domain S-box protein [Deltaproteobacteria bacterium]|nr:PAS domain S-box protein [Deltaproteobacteria bacterium]